MSKPSDAKEIEMKEISTPPEPKVHIVNITRVVKCCNHCQMVFINERKRILCPFCGSYYESKEEREKNQVNLKRSGKILKNRKNLNDKSDDDDDISIDNAEETSYKQIESSSNSGGFRNFFRNLVGNKQETKANNRSSTDMANKNIQNSNKLIEYNLIEETNLNHRFLTIKNRDPTLFSDYRLEIESINSIEAFR